MHARAHEFDEDVLTSIVFGRNIIEPPYHFSRVFRFFGKEERRKLLMEAYDFDQSLHTKPYSIEQFIAWTLYVSEDEAYTNDWGGDPDKVDLNKLPSPCLRAVTQTVAGENYRALAVILSNTLLDPANLSEENFDDLFRQALGTSIITPATAAAVASCVAHSNCDFDRFENSSSGLIADGKILPSALFFRPHEHAKVYDDLNDLKALAGAARKTRAALIGTEHRIVRPDALYAKFNLEETASGLFVPQRKKIAIARSMEEAIRAAHASKEALHQMTPRRFEEFLAFVFKGLGFEVELTKATRDGGADLLCLRDLDGIPFRLAVEIKRYRDSRPINVSLVRSFVGANEQHKANQLLFVTTSSYTKPAKEYADIACRPHFLTLRDYQQIKEWCATLLKENPKII